MSWLEQLEQAKITLLRLRLSIRGNTPSQSKMAERLQEATRIVETQITVEEALAK